MDPHVLSAVARLPDHELLARVKQCAARERETTGSLIAHLAELDERRLYLAEGYSSLFVYCTQVLHFSEHAAYGRIQAARAVRRFPLILERLEDGSVNLTTVGLLAAYLTPENYQELLDMVRHRSKRQVEELVARRRPQPPVPSSVRKLPTGSHTPASPIAQHDAPTSPQPTGEPPAVGRRCIEEGFLEFHHVRPFAAGGEPTAKNIQLRCRAHNGYEADLAFGLRHRLVAREEHASYVSLPPSRAHRRGWGIPAATRSGPSTESAAARPWASVPRRLNPGCAGEKAPGSPGR